MIRILFICHGNICRSPMAEYVWNHMLRERGLSHRFFAASAATSTEEIGNPAHPGTLRKLRACGVPTPARRAVLLQPEDALAYDWLIGMDSNNVKNILRTVGGEFSHKVCRLLDFTKTPGSIADPWYTGDFDATYRDVCRGCEALLNRLLAE